MEKKKTRFIISIFGFKNTNIKLKKYISLDNNNTTNRIEKTTTRNKKKKKRDNFIIIQTYIIIYI